MNRKIKQPVSPLRRPVIISAALPFTCNALWDYAALPLPVRAGWD
jgi:hypothetical protein